MSDKNYIPEKGEQVVTETGEIKIGDGIHTVEQLPDPKILHD